MMLVSAWLAPAVTITLYCSQHSTRDLNLLSMQDTLLIHKSGHLLLYNS